MQRNLSLMLFQAVFFQLKPCYKIALFLVIIFSMLGCSLGKEPVLPEYTNEENPVFEKTTASFITHDSIHAMAKLTSRGSLNVVDFGWVLSTRSNPTVENNSIAIRVPKLSSDSVSTFISGLEVGKTYFIRPFLTNNSGVFYGEERSLTNNFAKIEQLSLSKDSACLLAFDYIIKTTAKLEEHGIFFVEGKALPALGINSIVQNSDALKIAGDASNRVDLYKAYLYNLKPNTLYSVCAFAKTTAGLSLSSIQTFTTVGERPSMELDFSINTDSILFRGAMVKFSNLSSGANSYLWKFGTSGETKVFSPTHVFDSTGITQVVLQGENQGCITKKLLKIKVEPNPFENHWVKLSGGDFTMGCTSEQINFCGSDEKPTHLVTLSPFEIGRTEITQKQWIAVMGYNPSYFSDCGENCPVELVDYYNIIQNFIPKLNRMTGRVHRLPTEAEWEYAARGGQSFLYSGSQSISEVGWHSGNSDQRTYQVGLKKPNGFGLYDMTGNVWEWCSDLYSTSYYRNSPKNDPQGPTQTNFPFRVRRGGSFDTSVEGEYNPRASFRWYYTHFQANWTIGFRLVRVPQ